ncbi:MAG: type I restriction-modification system subunit M [Pyrinomonadaceae bacterium]
MSEEQKKLLEQQLWNIANTLRGKMDADEFRDYILGFIFYKYLSERMNAYADSILQEDGITFQNIDEKTEEGKKFLEAIKEESIETLGYFLKPSELFSAVARRGNGNGTDKNGESESTFILEDLAAILNNIEQSTMGTESEDDFDNLFEDLDLTSTKLGRTESAKNQLISKVLAHLDKIDFQLEDADSDVLGDAYEYLIGQFASGAGKKAGEFYTPQEVSRVLAKIVAGGKDKLKSVYDPTCGSGSLLLRVAKEVIEVGKFYGQELNRTTYNLARMNMILHGVHYQKFDIRQEDSLERPQHFDERFEAIVANPPFSAKWSANPLHLTDDRFSQYGRLAPNSKADFAFIQHMIHQLGDNGTMAVVVPHGVLFRGGAEGHIRQYLIEDRNYLDAVIGLPANIFYGTSIPTCVLVFKKCKESPDNILFIDASREFGKRATQNFLRDEDINKIITTLRDRRTEDKYSYAATLGEVKQNDFNLNIPRYVDIFEPDEPIDIAALAMELSRIEETLPAIDKTILEYCEQLGISTPF